MKLDTAEKILGWAESVEMDSQHFENHFAPINVTTAERLALAMRVLEIVEEHSRDCGWLHLDPELFLSMWIEEDAEAAQKEGK